MFYGCCGRNSNKKRDLKIRNKKLTGREDFFEKKGNISGGRAFDLQSVGSWVSAAEKAEKCRRVKITYQEISGKRVRRKTQRKEEKRMGKGCTDYQEGD